MFSTPAASPDALAQMYRQARQLPGHAFLPWLLERLSLLLGSPFVSVHTWHSSGSYHGGASHGLDREAMGREFMALGLQRYDILSHAMLERPGDAHVVNWDDARLQAASMAASRDFLQRFGIRHSMGVAVTLEGTRCHTAFHINRGPGQAPFSAEDAVELAALAPHLGELIMVNRLFLGMTHGLRDESMRPVALVSAEGWVLFANRAFVDATHEAVKAGQLVQGDRFDPLWLRDLMRSPRPLRLAPGSQWAATVVPFDEGLRLELQAPGPWQELTGREREVAALVCRGLSSKDAALAIEVSPNTVRQHLRSVYQKLGIGSRRQLRAMWLAEK